MSHTRLCVDFDGTLTHGEAKFWEGEIEQPRQSVCEYVREKYYEDWTIIIWTARPWSEANMVAARLTEWEVPFHAIRCEKGGGDVYLDDRAKHVDDIL